MTRGGRGGLLRYVLWILGVLPGCGLFEPQDFEVRGTVYLDGVPVQGFSVWASGPSESDPGYLTYRSTTSDGTGRYALIVPNCDFALSASPDHLVLEPFEDAEGARSYSAQEVCEGGDGFDFSFTRIPAGRATVTGTVVAWGTPVVGAEIVVSGAEVDTASTDATGEFRSDSVPWGDYVVQLLDHPDAVFDSSTVTTTLYPGENFVDFVGNPDPRPLWLSISAGAYHTCGVTTDGIGYCWGRNREGALGDGTLQSRARPVPVLGGHTWASIDAGDNVTCGVAESGAGFCWGDRHTTPQNVPGGLVWSTIETGPGRGYCGIDSNEAARCWGWIGRIPTGSPVGPFEPTEVERSSSWISVTTGYDRSCGVLDTGDAYCWGGEVDEMDVDVARELTLEAEQVGGGHRWTTVTSGGGQACGVTELDAAYCWGRNEHGELGNGPGPASIFTDPASPALVEGGHSWVALAAGGSVPLHDELTPSHTCGLTSSGAAYCWGSGREGRLGNGVDGPVTRTPVRVLGSYTWASISAGSAHSCGVTVDGEGYCWGEGGWGRIGDGTADDRLVPRRIGGN